MADRHNRDIDRARAPLPEPLPVPTVDSHAHLEIVTDAAFDSQGVADVIAEAKSVNVDRIVQVGYSADQSKWCVQAAEKWSTSVLAAVALHPNEAPVVADLEADLKIIEELAQHPRVRAIGETGLDYFRTPPELRKRQQDSFKWHIELAKKTKKALVIHDRDSHDDVLSVLLEVGAPEKVVFHCFSGDVAMAKLCIERGYILSFAGTLTFKNAPELRAAVKLVPADQLLVETDSPFLAPSPHRGAGNTPAQIANIVRAMAVERDQDLAELATDLSVNAERIFGSFAP
ncbi:MAG: AraC family transcriptional regulator [Actinobacteria bacterium BACL15 MAG-120619-bin91]|jgi:TatD DNase family protein|uniref:AraC family transcriptional regulator n=1 Tax=Actinobacteria bacterium BACL15 MAG-120619-bin91 TaxID=1655562 RepID=A0A0R2PEI6_9ACTN|nr:MAG: AraC family transcriptional regulator [Actinobacteria bacterium BACL15 MAG-120619-bin91]